MPYFEFLEKLRSATGKHHENLEKSPVSAKLLSPSVTRQDYINYLLASYHLHRPIENEAFPLLAGTIDDIESRKKAGAIQTDLLALGQPAIQHTRLFLSNKSANIPFCMGVMYVVEGSTLGGLHIAKAIGQTVGSNAPKAFLTVYGQLTGQRWKHFLQLLDDFTNNNPAPAIQDEIIEGALFTFDKAQHIFNDSYITNGL